MHFFSLGISSNPSSLYLSSGAWDLGLYKAGSRRSKQLFSKKASGETICIKMQISDVEMRDAKHGNDPTSDDDSSSVTADDAPPERQRRKKPKPVRSVEVPQEKRKKKKIQISTDDTEDEETSNKHKVDPKAVDSDSDGSSTEKRTTKKKRSKNAKGGTENDNDEQASKQRSSKKRKTTPVDTDSEDQPRRKGSTKKKTTTYEDTRDGTRSSKTKTPKETSREQEYPERSAKKKSTAGKTSRTKKSKHAVDSDDSDESDVDSVILSDSDADEEEINPFPANSRLRPYNEDYPKDRAKTKRWINYGGQIWYAIQWANEAEDGKTRRLQTMDVTLLPPGDDGKPFKRDENNKTSAGRINIDKLIKHWDAWKVKIIGVTWSITGAPDADDFEALETDKKGEYKHPKDLPDFGYYIVKCKKGGKNRVMYYPRDLGRRKQGGKHKANMLFWATAFEQERRYDPSITTPELLRTDVRKLPRGSPQPEDNRERGEESDDDDEESDADSDAESEDDAKRKKKDKNGQRKRESTP